MRQPIPPVPAVDHTETDAPKVSVLRWPDEAGRRRQLAAQGLPRVLVVDSAAEVPTLIDALEDWIRWPPDPADLLRRTDVLRRRAVEQARPAAHRPVGAPTRPIVLRWPEDAELREALRAAAFPRLLIVDDGRMVPTDGGPLEDWTTTHAGSEEIEARIDALASRAGQLASGAPFIDDDDLLRFGDRWVALGELEARIGRLLVDRLGRVVRRADITRAAWGDAAIRSNTIDAAIHRFRRHAASLGLQLVTIRSRGFMLRAPAPRCDPSDTGS